MVPYGLLLLLLCLVSVLWWDNVRADEDRYLLRAERGMDRVVEALREDVLCFRLAARQNLEAGEVFRLKRPDGEDPLMMYPVRGGELDSTIPMEGLPFKVPALVDINLRFQFTEPLALGNDTSQSPLEREIRRELDRSIWTRIDGARVKLVDSVLLRTRVTAELLQPPLKEVAYEIVDRRTGALLFRSHLDSLGVWGNGQELRRPVFSGDSELATIDLRVWFPGSRWAMIRDNLGGLIISVLVVSLLAVLVQLILRNLLERNRVMMARNDLLTNMTHELNTPLANIGMAVDTLRKGTQGQAELAPAKLVEIIKRETEKLAGTVRKVLDVSLLETQDLPLSKEYHEMTELVQRAVESFRPAFEGVQAILGLETDGDEHWVLCDRTYVEQVLQIVLDNALKYGGKNVVVRVTRGSEQGRVELRIQDDGPGLTTEERSLVFEKFRRGKAADPYAVQGTGIGLYHAKLVVEAHQGRIQLLPRRPHGTMVVIEIPQNSNGAHLDR